MRIGSGVQIDGGITIEPTVYPTGAYITATGGTITTSGNYKIHTFTTSGTFDVTQLSSNTNNLTILTVGGGGGAGGSGSARGGGGGGAGQVTESSYSLQIAASFVVTVGSGGPGGDFQHSGSLGTNSSIEDFGPGTITSISGNPGKLSWGVANPGYGGDSGNGFSGGVSFSNTLSSGGGGGGATQAGGHGWNNNSYPGNGGAGYTSTITGNTYGGGGGGGQGLGIGENNGPAGTGGVGGGGNGGSGSGQNDGYPGTVNTGGGGGGGTGTAGSPSGGNGGSGIVVIRYQYTA